MQLAVLSINRDNKNSVNSVQNKNNTCIELVCGERYLGLHYLIQSNDYPLISFRKPKEKKR